MYKIALSEARVGMVLAETVMSALNDAPFLAGHSTQILLFHIFGLSLSLSPKQKSMIPLKRIILHIIKAAILPLQIILLP